MGQRTSIETTIKGGLPVLAEGTIVSPPVTRGSGNRLVDGPEWPGHEWVDGLVVRFKSGHIFQQELSEADESRIIEELLKG